MARRFFRLSHPILIYTLPTLLSLLLVVKEKRLPKKQPPCLLFSRGPLALAHPNGFFGLSRAGNWDLGDVRGGSDADSQLLADLGIHLYEDVLVLFEEAARVFAALPDALARVAIPGTRFFHDVVGHRQVQHVAFAADAFAIKNVEFSFAERRSHLVLHDLDLGARADDGVAFFHGGDAADIDAHGRIELQSAAAGRGFGVTEHDTDLFANLVDEDERGARFGDGAGELAQGLRHEPGLQSHVGVAHF